MKICGRSHLNIAVKAMNYKMLPKLTFTGKIKLNAPGLKFSKNRITFAHCSNASGSNKLPLFLIEKSSMARVNKNINSSPQSLYYSSQNLL